MARLVAESEVGEEPVDPKAIRPAEPEEKALETEKVSYWFLQ
jgi:hypothetical protein